MELTPEVVVGIVIIFAIAQVIILASLKKAGVISFGLTGKCSEHDTFCKSFKTMKTEFKVVRDEHLLQGQTIGQYGKELDEGKIVFNDIKKNIAKININVALIKRELKINEDD